MWFVESYGHEKYLGMYKKKKRGFGCNGHGNENLINFDKIVIFYGLTLLA